MMETRSDGSDSITALATRERAEAEPRPRGRGHAPFRKDIQALRALAVALVVAFHLWPGAVRGGYVGVDVFFVLSGYLITGQLTREALGTGRIRLLSFWSRRVRRLLPAALTVLALTGIAVFLFVPRTLWQQFFSEIGGSAVYGQNWLLVHDAVDYFGSGGGSPVQNFWSLSVEEQFYLVWPLLILIPLLVFGLRRVSRRTLLAVLTIATVASFVYGLVITHQNPAISYLATTSRGWEFGVGGMLALVTVPARVPAWLRALASWAGIAAILASALLYTSGTPFPGSAALLPVLGAIVVVAAGMPEVPWSPARLFGLGRVQWLGDASYSLYLWHWPLIVLAPFLMARLLPGVDSDNPLVPFVVLALSLVLAGASKRFLEDPLRHAAILKGRGTRRSFVFMVVGMAAVVGLAFSGWGTAQVAVASAKQQTQNVLASSPACLGAAAMDPSAGGCPNPDLEGVLVPTPTSAGTDRPHACLLQKNASTPKVCESGVPADEASTTVALVGDSHAAQWFPALRKIALANDWHVVEVMKASCPFADATRRGDPDFVASCTRWNEKAMDELESTPGLSTVFTSADVKDLFASKDGGTSYSNGVAGFTKAWAALPKSVKHVYAIADTAHPRSDVLKCLGKLDRGEQLAPGACGVERDQAIGHDPLVGAARASDRATLIDMNDLLCTKGSCAPVIGNVLVYRDQSHLSRTYAVTMTPYLARAIGVRG